MADAGVAGIAAEGDGGAMSGLKFDHLGVVVRELESGREFLRAGLGIGEWSEVFVDEGIGVYVQFGRGEDGPCYELIAPLGETSPVAGALQGGKHILNHVAYRTGAMEVEGERLRGLGCVAAGQALPAVAYGGKRVQFWLSPLRFMIELIEAPEHEHVYPATNHIQENSAANR